MYLYDGGSSASPFIPTGYWEETLSSTNMLFIYFESDNDIQNDYESGGFYFEYLSYDPGTYFLHY